MKKVVALASSFGYALGMQDTTTARPVRPTFSPKSYYSDATNELLRTAYEAGCDHCESMDDEDYRLLPHYVIGRLAMVIDFSVK